MGHPGFRDLDTLKYAHISSCGVGSFLCFAVLPLHCVDASIWCSLMIPVRRETSELLGQKTTTQYLQGCDLVCYVCSSVLEYLIISGVAQLLFSIHYESRNFV